MSAESEHERALVQSFILPDRQERYLELLAKPERRRDITKTLAHFKHLDMRFATKPPHTTRDIVTVLLAKGAPETCHVISEDSDLDGKEISLIEGLETIHGRGVGTFLSCVPGRLAYFEAEEGRWILERKAVR